MCYFVIKSLSYPLWLGSPPPKGIFLQTKTPPNRVTQRRETTIHLLVAFTRQKTSTYSRFYLFFIYKMLKFYYNSLETLSERLNIMFRKGESHMKKVIGIVSQINMLILITAIFFLLYDVTLLKLNALGNKTIGAFYMRELIALLLSMVTVKLFFRIENRYKEDK